ncbi:MAG: universal stress protein [Acidobacteriota bacterium]|nr:universal stress protein [Acidobacteriota bacterium]
MAHVSQRLRNAFDGALAGGGDPASSPLYVFGPFIQFIVVAGVAGVTFGASVWLVVFTVVVVSLMYRQVIRWVTDGTGGSGLTEEEFGAWAVKLNSAITFVEYTLTFLVSIAALVELIADRVPLLNQSFHGIDPRTPLAIIFSISIGWLVNRGPKTAARTFGPATLGVLLLLWTMILATIWKTGFHLPNFDLKAFTPHYLSFTLSGFSRLLALMTGIEVFANLVAAYEGTPAQRSRKAFESLLIAMGTTCATMLIVGPAIFHLSDPTDPKVSVFTQTMDKLLPAPVAYFGSFIGIVVLASAAAASAQGLQNLALGLRYRHYVPARMGQRNDFDVADMPVWIEVSIASICFVLLGTQEDVYLSLYAAGVFILLSMTGWAAAKRFLRLHSGKLTFEAVIGLIGSGCAALLTTAATAIIFIERFTHGAWAYLLFLPVIYYGLTHMRKRLGEPVPLSEHLGRLYTDQYLLPFQRKGARNHVTRMEELLVPLDGSKNAEQALTAADVLAHTFGSSITLLSVDPNGRPTHFPEQQKSSDPCTPYLADHVRKLKAAGIQADCVVEKGKPYEVITSMAQDMGADLIVMTAYGQSNLERLFVSDIAQKTLRIARTPILLVRPEEMHAQPPTTFKRLLVALDGSRHAEETLRFARKFAVTFTSEIILLGVPEADFEEEQLTDYLNRVANALREEHLQVRALVTGSGAARTITEVSESEHIDLVILAKYGRGGSLRRSAALGSVAIHAVESVHCPILLIDTAEYGRARA